MLVQHARFVCVGVSCCLTSNLTKIVLIRPSCKHVSVFIQKEEEEEEEEEEEKGDTC
jgi:hypothetical protein